MDISKLSTSDRLIVGGGTVYLISMFLEWFSRSEGGFSISATGWDYFLGGIIPLLLIIVMVLHVLLTRFSPTTELPDPPVPWGQVHLVAGAAAAAIVLLRLIIPAEIEFGGFSTGENFDRSYGIVIALVAAVVVAVGGFQKSKESGDTPAADGGTSPF